MKTSNLISINRIFLILKYQHFFIFDFSNVLKTVKLNHNKYLKNKKYIMN